MTVFFINTFSLVKGGGIGTVSRNLAKEFGRRGINVLFIVANEGADAYADEIKEYVLGDKDILSERNRNRLSTLINHYKPDYVINQSGLSTELIDLINTVKQTDTTVVTCYHGAVGATYNHYDQIVNFNLSKNSFTKFLKPILWRLLRLNYRAKTGKQFKYVIDHSDKYVFLSEEYIDELSIYSKEIDYSKLVSIPNPHEIEHVNSIPVSDKEQRVLYVGRINFNEKRCDLLIPLWEKVNRKLPEWKLDVVGDGKHLDLLQKTASEKGLENVHFHGYMNPMQLYKKASLLILTSATEGFGMVVLEAQSNNVIPIVFNVSTGLNDLITNNENGHLIQPFDIDAMADKMVEIARMENPKKQIQSNLHKSIVRFSSKHVVNKWVEEVFQQ